MEICEFGKWFFRLLVSSHTSKTCKNKRGRYEQKVGTREDLLVPLADGVGSTLRISGEWEYQDRGLYQPRYPSLNLLSDEVLPFSRISSSKIMRKDGRTYRKRELSIVLNPRKKILLKRYCHPYFDLTISSE